MFLLKIQIGISRQEKRLKHIKRIYLFRFILSDHLNTYENRSEAVAKVLNDMRARDCLKTLRGWRDEVNINNLILIEEFLFLLLSFI
jgi:hypothetical protein